MARITVTATLQDVFGNALAGSSGGLGGLFVQLCGYGSQIPRVGGTAVLAQTTPLEAQPGAAGLVSFTLYGNDAITPASTYYTVQAVDSNGNVIQTNAYQFTGAGPYDLSTAPLYAPDPVPPAPPIAPVVGSLVVLAPSSAPVFPASTAGVVTYDLTLIGNTVATMPTASPGQVVILNLRQDGTGFHSFIFPANFDPNWTPPNPSPNSKSTQAGFTDAVGHIYPIGPGSYN